MFFEGAEKKVEIVVSKGMGNLRELGQGYWAEVVSACEATILSKISNQYCDAYLLSESSLFVWDHYLLMLTCGQTRLVRSVCKMIDDFKAENLESLIFQRKNEYRAKEQHSSFLEDVETLKSKVDGRAMRFGKIHSHHNLIFHLSKKYAAESDDKTTEMLMYDISAETGKFLTAEGNSVERVRDFFCLDKVLPGFEIDDFVFKPYGYSLNAIKDDKYYTIHVTPQEGCPYISFETNIHITNEKQGILKHFLEVLKPASFDVIAFNGSATQFDFGANYSRRTASREKLSIGYNVEFGYYFKEDPQIEKPFYF